MYYFTLILIQILCQVDDSSHDVTSMGKNLSNDEINIYHFSPEKGCVSIPSDINSVKPSSQCNACLEQLLKIGVFFGLPQILL